MLSEQFDLYYQETKTLVDSFVFKFDIQNVMLNNYIKALGHIVDEDPRTWKYNLNLAGEYHALDAPMTVISSDTQSEISFDKNTLLLHPRTKVRHARGQDDFTKLVARYPNQELLINGIGRPIAMDDVIAARDFQLLDYNRTLIAANETTLIARIQKWVDNHVDRNWNPDFATSNPLYPASFIATMAQLLVGAVMVIRSELAHTSEASQYEIWTYLSNHYNLDEYRNFLTLPQSLWLYRNIVDIRKNAGKTKKLEAMLENLAKPSGLNISKVDFIQLDVGLLETKKRTSSFSFSDYFSDEVSLASGNLFNSEQLHELISDQAPYNPTTLDTDSEEASKKGNALQDNRLPTKVLRADEDGSLKTQTVTNLPMKVNYWVYLSHLDKYTPDFTIDIPNAGSIFLSAKEAFILYVYAANTAIGNPMVEIPAVTVKSVIPVSYPIATDLERFVPTGSAVGGTDIARLLDNLVEIRECNSMNEFTRFVDEILNQELRKDLEENLFQDPVDRSVMRDLSNALITDIEVPLVDTVTRYDDWLYDNGIDAVSLTQQDWWDICSTILSTVVDYTGDNTSIGARQRAMVKILDSLTSYDVFILGGEGTGRSRELNFPNMLLHRVHFDIPISERIIAGEEISPRSAVMVETTATLKIENGLEVNVAPQPAVEQRIESGETVNFEIDRASTFFIHAPVPSVRLVSVDPLP